MTVMLTRRELSQLNAKISVVTDDRTTASDKRQRETPLLYETAMKTTPKLAETGNICSDRAAANAPAIYIQGRHPRCSGELVNRTR